MNTQPQRIPLIDISGSPRQLGQQHGEGSRDQIESSLDYYRDSFERHTRLDWTQLLDRTGEWDAVLAAYAPDLVTEMEGIAEAAGRTYREILLLNLRSEIAYDIQVPELGEDGCTSFALTPDFAGDSHTYCGQNWDWRAGAKDSLICLRITQPGQPTIIMQTEAGQIGRHGANAAGVALNANGLGGGFHGRVGVPQTFLRRRILQARTLHDALKVVFDTRQHIPANLMLTYRGGIAIDLETTPFRHQWLTPDSGILVHGNHYQAMIPPQLAETYRPFSVDSIYRVSQLERLLRTTVGSGSTEEVRRGVKLALANHLSYPQSLCAHASRVEGPDGWLTIASSLVDLTTGEYFLAAGNPCKVTHEKLPWNLYME